ncbi:MAG: DUF559 domain-containing protein [Chloroflexota bacterium]|nr:MAG: DUF559 domain-containing protein [Chloroflexota bacterium]
MELQRIVWTWPSLVARLATEDVRLSQALDRACRPLAAERSGDERLTLVLGCWLEDELQFLSDETNIARLANALGALLEERVDLEIVPWPAGMAAAHADVSAPVQAPDLLDGLPEEAREEAIKCETPIQRYFFAEAWRRGIRFRCQHPVLTYRLDFALPRQKIGVEIVGWRWLQRGTMGRYERGQSLGGLGWQVLWFSGHETSADVDSCLDRLARLLTT